MDFCCSANVGTTWMASAQGQSHRQWSVFISEKSRERSRGMGGDHPTGLGGDGKWRGAQVSLTSVGHCEDGVLRDTHSEGHLPELLHEVLPQLRLPPCMGKAEGTMAVTHGQQKFHLGQSCPEDRHPGKKRCPPWMPPALLRPHPTQGSFKDPRHSLALEF